MKINQINYMQNTVYNKQNMNTYDDESFEDILKATQKDEPSQKEIQKCSQMLEAWFVREMLSQVNWVGQSSDSVYRHITEGIILDTISEAVTKGEGIGISKQLMDTFKIVP